MERRTFLAHVACLPLTFLGVALAPKEARSARETPASTATSTTIATTTAKPAGRRLTLLFTGLAGWHYYEGETLCHRINPGDSLELRREPHNPHDRRAIAVYWNRAELGYIPRTDNTVIARLMDQQAPYTARVIAHIPGPDPRKRLALKVEMEG